jgi:hypothetical protein
MSAIGPAALLPACLLKNVLVLAAAKARRPDPRRACPASRVCPPRCRACRSCSPPIERPSRPSEERQTVPSTHHNVKLCCCPATVTKIPLAGSCDRARTEFRSTVTPGQVPPLPPRRDANGSRTAATRISLVSGKAYVMDNGMRCPSIQIRLAASQELVPANELAAARQLTPKSRPRGHRGQTGCFGFRNTQQHAAALPDRATQQQQAPSRAQAPRCSMGSHGWRIVTETVSVLEGGARTRSQSVASPPAPGLDRARPALQRAPPATREGSSGAVRDL